MPEDRSMESIDSDHFTVCGDCGTVRWDYFDKCPVCRLMAVAWERGR